MSGEKGRGMERKEKERDEWKERKARWGVGREAKGSGLKGWGGRGWWGQRNRKEGSGRKGRGDGEWSGRRTKEVVRGGRGTKGVGEKGGGGRD